MAMHDDDRWDEEVRESYQRPIVDEVRARERVIARLRDEPAPRRSRWAGWWTDPDAIRARPLLAVASLVAALGVGAWGGAWWVISSRGVPAASKAAAVVQP